MKRNIFITIFALIIALSFAGCGGNDSNNMMSDIRDGMQSAEDKVESGIDKAEDKMDNSFNNAEDKLQNGMDSMDAKISRDEAKRIALDHAKVTDTDIKNYHIDLDKDNGVLEYDIEFDHSGTEYDYEIDANTGEIREHSTDKAD